MRKSVCIVAPLWALFLAACLVVPAVQSKFLSDADSEDLASGEKLLRAITASTRRLEDIPAADDDFFDDDFLFGDDIVSDLVSDIFGDIESLRLQDENLFTCLTVDLAALTVDESEAFEDINTAFLDSVPEPGEDPSLIIGLDFEAEALATLLQGCDLLDGFLLQQEGPLTCDFPSEDGTDITTGVTGFAQCFPNTEACINADANLFISFTFSLAGAECDYGDFSSADDEPVPNEEEESVIEEEEEEEDEPAVEEEEEEEEETEEEDVVPDEEIVDTEPDVPLPPPEENPTEEVMTTVIAVPTEPEPEPEYPFQNLVVGQGGAPRAYIRSNIRRPMGGNTLPPVSF